MSVSARQFAFDLRAFNIRTRDDLTDRFRFIALSLDQRVVLRTPVDTGRARGGWYVSLNQPSTQVSNRTDPSGSAPLAELASVIVDAQLGDVIWMTNNLPYIVKLENGSSQQAPQGMVAVSMAEIGAAL